MTAKGQGGKKHNSKFSKGMLSFMQERRNKNISLALQLKLKQNIRNWFASKVSLSFSLTFEC